MAGSAFANRFDSTPRDPNRLSIRTGKRSKRKQATQLGDPPNVRSAIRTVISASWPLGIGEGVCKWPGRVLKHFLLLMKGRPSLSRSWGSPRCLWLAFQTNSGKSSHGKHLITLWPSVAWDFHAYA